MERLIDGRFDLRFSSVQVRLRVREDYQLEDARRISGICGIRFGAGIDTHGGRGESIVRDEREVLSGAHLRLRMLAAALTACLWVLTRRTRPPLFQFLT